MSVTPRAFASHSVPTMNSPAPGDFPLACPLLNAGEKPVTPSFSQLEKLLMIVAFDPEFAEQLIRYGESAKTRYAFEHDEGQLLDRLLSNGGVAMRAIQNVFRATIETHEAIRP